ncbi:hypothetical protein [Winogradskyella sp. SYSU M77433]|uniref:hypothetical protein n=1 Tax=Winogradskyella sp. SYSU M77433 TaxID=3042722 RepID=UPI00247FEA3B|nr:hypothetical protein [Winogradskyella sp. SYSU M77433]MDH7913193.1 hypothetical protein [Winogradskyella sp. SYSU M77433]
MNKIFFFFFLGVLLFSCDNNKGEFIIINESDFNIESLNIMPDSKKQFINLKKGETKEHFIFMDEVKTDGSYYMSYINSESKKAVLKPFGYYTNGYQIENAIHIRILNDTILVDGEFNKPY